MRTVVRQPWTNSQQPVLFLSWMLLGVALVLEYAETHCDVEQFSHWATEQSSVASLFNKLKGVLFASSFLAFWWVVGNSITRRAWSRSFHPSHGKAESPLTEHDRRLQAHFVQMKALFIVAILVFLPFILVMVLHEMTTFRITAMFVVVWAGAIGAFISRLARFETLAPKHIELWQRTSFYVIAASWIPGLVGVIGAAILYVVFASGLIEGTLFPEFACLPMQECDSFSGFVRYWSPNGEVAYGKAIVWGFLAGFSERLVPDFLNRLASLSPLSEAGPDPNSPDKEKDSTGKVTG